MGKASAAVPRAAQLPRPAGSIMESHKKKVSCHYFDMSPSHLHPPPPTHTPELVTCVQLFRQKFK